MREETVLKSSVLIESLRRQAQGKGAFATIVKKGDADGGAIFVLRSWLDGRFQVFGQVRDMDGRLGWRASKPGEFIDFTEAQAYIDRQHAFDSDIWVLEIEDRSDDLFLNGPILGE